MESKILKKGSDSTQKFEQFACNSSGNLNRKNKTSRKSDRRDSTPSFQAQLLKLFPIWQNITDDYELLEVLGAGTFGQVAKAKSLRTGEIVAIKLLTDMCKDSYQAKKLVSEIHILRKLSAVPNNVFTTRLHDLVLPGKESPWDSDQPLEFVFLVLDYMPFDLNGL